MKKVILSFLIAIIACLSLAVVAGAQEAYLEKIPDSLKIGDSDTAEYFIVFEEAKYFTASGTTITGLVDGEISLALDTLAVANSDLKTALGTKYLFKYVFPDGSTYIKFSSFKNHQYFINVAGAIVFPSTVATVDDMNNSVGQLRSIDFGENSKVTAIPYGFATMDLGKGTTKLVELKNFPKKLTSIAGTSFSRSPYLNGVLYLNAESIGDSAFNNSLNSVDGIVFGPDVKSIGNQSFTVYETGKNIEVKFIEFQCDITQVSFALVANDYGSFYFEIGSGNQRYEYNNITCLVLSHPNNQANIVEGTTTIQDFVSKLYFNKASASTGNLVQKGHNYESAIDYESFLDYGIKGNICKDCQAVGESEKVPPIFVCLGYSCSQYGTASITQGFAIDHQMLETYNALKPAEEQIGEYGLIAANAELIGDTAFDTAGAIKAGAVYTSLSNRASRYDIMEMTVCNIIGDDHDYSDMLLHSVAYFKLGDAVMYINNGKISETIGQGVSYNELNK